MSTVVVTGGSEFAGSQIILQLLEAGNVVRATVRSLQREASVRAMLEGAGAKPADPLSQRHARLPAALLQRRRRA